MGGAVPGKLLVVIGIFIVGALKFTEYSGLSADVLWGLAIVLIVLGVFNWGVR